MHGDEDSEARKLDAGENTAHACETELDIDEMNCAPILIRITKQTLCLSGAVVLCGALAACDPGDKYAKGEVAARLRSRPAQLLYVAGEKDPQFEIAISVVYFTTEKSCRYTVNRIEGVKDQHKHIFKVPVRQSGTAYEAVVPLDTLEPGPCGWLPYSVNYTVFKNSIPHRSPVPPTPLLWLRDGAPDKLPPFEVECGEQEAPGKPGLECRKAHGNYYLNPGAKALRAAFRERAWFGTPNAKLGEQVRRGSGKAFP
ncbi:MAG: hypothetical protein K9J74_14285 [Sulfuritalea sp.]|nr:hypothetical protein [Sulfuritalea sp.]